MFTTKPTTVDGVLSAFRTTIDNLNAVASAQSAKAAEQEVIAANALAAKAAAEAESSRAVDVAGKLQAIFG